MGIIQTQTIDWAPFSAKQKAYIRKALKSRISVAEGAIRSRKTVLHCLIGAIELEKTPDKIHLATGSTSANAKMNIGDCNGFGLEHLFRGRCRWGQYKGNDALFIYPNPTKPKTGDNENIVVFAGGGKRDSYRKILGNSYGLWIATEINEHYDSDDSRESFLKVAMGRQIASKNPKVLWDLNPCDPNNKIYAEYIDKYAKSGAEWYNYEHFTLYDNPAVSPDRIKELESRYVPGTIWHKRDILGERCVAEGLVYQIYADNPEQFATSSKSLGGLSFVNVGVDFGGNGSATTFVATGFFDGLKRVVPLFSERLKHNGTTDSERINTAFIAFISKVYGKVGKGMSVYCDSAEQVLINGMKTASARAGLPVRIMNAIKSETNERIRLINMLLAQGRFFVSDEAQTVNEAMCQAVWSKKEPDKRLDNGTTDIDTIDALEYSIEPYMRELSRI